MLEFLRQLVTGVAQAWGHLTATARVQIVLAALISLSLIGGVVLFGSQPQYVQLYSRLDVAESREIQIWLTDNNIPNRFKQGGQEIEVPIGDVATARVGLSALGIPKSQGVVPGWEMFDNVDLMTNNFLQDVNYMRALQGHLQITLNQYDFVRRSSVFIREAQEQLFVNDQQPSQASVTLDTTGPLTKTQVKAVLHTVSSFGGANLSPKNVAITMSDGTILHEPSEDAFASLANDKLEMQVDLERQREEKILRMFAQLPVRAVVSVSALMDWTSEEKRARLVQLGEVIASEETESTTENIEQPAQGAPGAIANIPEGLGSPGSAGISTKETMITENFDPSETVTTTLTPGGGVRKFKVSAFIEGRYTEETDADGNTTSEYQPLTEEDIARYTSFIQNAVGEGAEPTEIVVFDHPFDLDQVPTAQAGITVGLPWYQNSVVQFGIQAAAILAFFILIRVFMRRALVMPTVEEEEMVEIPEASPAELRRQEIAAEVERLSSEEPETVASLLRTWITEDD